MYLVLTMGLAACGTSETVLSDRAPATPTLAAWEPIDSSFAGCAGGCGAHAEGPTPGVVAQPGAAIHERVHCPVSGAIFEINDTHPHTDIDGKPMYFCCEGCASYFRDHRDSVLRARGIL